MVEPVDPKQELLEHVRRMMETNNSSKPVNPINQCAEAAQLPYQTISMKEVSQAGTYTGPPKYLKQRSMPMEIPKECVIRLCDAMD